MVSYILHILLKINANINILYKYVTESSYEGPSSIS